MGIPRKRIEEAKMLKQKAAADVARVVFSSANMKAIAEATRLQVPSDNTVIFNETYKKNIIADLIARLKAANKFMTDEYLNQILLPMMFQITHNVLTADLSAEEVGALVGVANPELVQSIEDAYFPGKEGGTPEGRGLATAISQVIKQVKSEHQGVFLHKIRKQALGNNSQLQKSSVNAYMDRVKSCKKTIEDNPNIKAEEAGNLNPNCKDNFEFDVGTGKYGTFTFNHAKDFVFANKQTVESLVQGLIQGGNTNIQSIVASVVSQTQDTIDVNLITQVVNQQVAEKDAIAAQKIAAKAKVDNELESATTEKNARNTDETKKAYAIAKAASVFFEKCYDANGINEIKDIVGNFDSVHFKQEICNTSTYDSLSLPSCVTKADMVTFCNDHGVQEYQGILGSKFSESDFSELGS